MNITSHFQIPKDEIPYWVGYALMHGWRQPYLEWSESMTEDAVTYAVHHRIFTTFPNPTFFDEVDPE